MSNGQSEVRTTSAACDEEQNNNLLGVVGASLKPILISVLPFGKWRSAPASNWPGSRHGGTDWTLNNPQPSKKIQSFSEALREANRGKERLNGGPSQRPSIMGAVAGCNRCDTVGYSAGHCHHSGEPCVIFVLFSLSLPSLRGEIIENFPRHLEVRLGQSIDL